jgi:transcription elongation factor Elf1
MLPRRKPKAPKHASRWISPAHRAFIRTFACAMCDSMENVQCAHLRMGSGAGMGQKPDDYLTTPLCYTCHQCDQHMTSEPDFWQRYQANHGQSVHQLIDELCAASPKAREIREARNA